MTRNTLDACILLSDRKFCVSMGFLRGDCIWDLHNLMIFELNILLVHVHIEYICGWCNFSDTRLKKFPFGRWRILPWCNRKTLYGINLDTLMKILQLFKNNRIFEDFLLNSGFKKSFSPFFLFGFSIRSFCPLSFHWVNIWNLYWNSRRQIFLNNRQEFFSFSLIFSLTCL